MHDAFGVSVTVGAVTAKCIVDLVDEATAATRGISADTITRTIRVLAKTGTFSGLTYGTAITVAGDAYKILQALQFGDGARTEILCAKVT
jgi:hypothetical protein